jgi:hypothetical protein
MFSFYSRGRAQIDCVENEVHKIIYESGEKMRERRKVGKA